MEDLMRHSAVRAISPMMVGLAAFFGLSAPSGAASVSIGYELIFLSSPNLYEYRYSLSNVSLATPVSRFSIDFDPVSFSEGSLVISSSGLGNWSEQILASVPIFNVPAQYDAYKSVGAGLGIGDVQSGFAVRFAWLGADRPGSQAFTVYDPMTFEILEVGSTTAASGSEPEPVPGPDPGPITPSVPEPATTALLLAGLIGIAAALRRARGSTFAVRRG